MVFIKGEDINIGFARETVRGTPETPAHWLPGRTPTGVTHVVDKTVIRETKGTGIQSQAAVLAMKRAEGDLEFNVKSNTIVYLLLSLLGKITTTTDGAAYNHLIEVLTGNPQNPTLTLGLSQLGMQDYEYKKAICTSLEISTPVDDLVNATASFIGVGEATHTDYTPAFSTADTYFRHYDVTIKTATNVAGLAAASAMAIKEFSLNLVNNGRVNQNIGELNPTDVLSQMVEVTGSLTMDYMDETNHDIYAAETYKAMSITMTRTDVDLGGGKYPTITFTMPKISFTSLTPDRPIDDIASENIEFSAHYDDTLGYGIQVNVKNSVASYA